MLVDDYLDLVPGERRARSPPAAALVDTHLARAGVQLPLAPLADADPGSRPLPSEGPGGHARHAGGAGADSRRPEVTVVDSGCCGMAGSFGYEHYDLSMAIGERVLFPAVRQAPDAIIVAPGFSCRHQIEHGTGRQALHPVELFGAAISVASQCVRGGTP